MVNHFLGFTKTATGLKSAPLRWSLEGTAEIHESKGTAPRKPLVSARQGEIFRAVSLRRLFLISPNAPGTDLGRMERSKMKVTCEIRRRLAMHYRKQKLSSLIQNLTLSIMIFTYSSTLLPDKVWPQLSWWRFVMIETF